MSKVSERARNNGRRRRHAGLAWLAALTLLIDALLPAALSAATGLAASATGIYCGATPAQHDPAKQGQSAPHHCVLCIAAPAGLAPGHPPAVSAPRFAEFTVPSFGFFERLAEPLAYAAAQPRGPPVAV